MNLAYSNIQKKATSNYAILSPMLHQHKNILFLAIGVLVTLLLAFYPPFNAVIDAIQGMGPVGIVIGGILLSIIFTFTSGALILTSFGHTVPPIAIALIGALGSTGTGFVIYLMVRDDLAKSKYFTEPHHFKRLLSSPYFRWTLPVIGALIVISPLPDEIGIALMGVTRMKPWQFLLIIYTLDTIGIYSLVSLANAIVR